eukprot:Skav212952  [mRNA]  locus=scaffold5129:11069:13197:+ [translate_table: standard]
MSSPLADLGRRKFVSQSALSELLKELKALPELPDATSRFSVKRAREEKVNVETPLGQLFQDVSLPTTEGITHGKFHAYYWTFKELEHSGLTREELWFTCCVMRSPNVAQLKGGVSALTKAVAKSFETFARGLVLASPGNQRRFLFARLKCLVADEAALKSMWGVKGASDGMLFDPSVPLKPVEHTMYDWLHIYLVHGVFQVHVNLLLSNLQSIGHSHSHVVTFFKTFTAPKEQASNFKGAVSTFEKAKSKDSWRPAASEVLCLYPLLRLFVLATGLADVFRTPFLVLLRILDTLSAHNKGQTIDAGLLMDLIKRHLVTFKAAYGPEPMTPKFHYSVHLPSLLQRHGLLVSCWTHERKHKGLKQFANQQSNAGAWYEKSLIREVTHTCISTLEKFEPHGVRLVTPKVLSGSLRLSVAEVFGHDVHLQFGRSVCNHGLFVHGQDVVTALHNGFEERVGQCHMHVQPTHDHVFSLVHWWDPAGKNVFRASGQSSWIPAAFLGWLPVI